MSFEIDLKFIYPSSNLAPVVTILNVSHLTVAVEFGFTKDNNPSNNAFIDEPTLRNQLNNGIDLYTMSVNDNLMGCVAIEKSTKETGIFYIEKVSVIPEYRNQGFGVKLMDFAISKIVELGGKIASVALIDSNAKLKNWYSSQGFIETGNKDFVHLPFRVCFMNKQL
jgi:diamine N-acetyltransferase